MTLPDASMPAHWQPYVAVDDPDRTTAKATDLGCPQRLGVGPLPRIEAGQSRRWRRSIGVVRDVYQIAGTAFAAVALGYSAREAFPYQGTLYLVDHDGEIEPFVPVG